MQPGHSYKTFAASSNSMAPTIANDAIVLGDLSAYRTTGPRRRDIVVFYPPRPSRDPFIKRVVGIPGETFAILKRTMRIDGVSVAEPYLSERSAYDMAVRNYGIYVSFGSKWSRLDSSVANIPPRAAWSSPDRIPPGYYVLLGDNRNDSEDAHIWGFAQSSGRIASGPEAGLSARSFVRVVKILPPQSN
jgi:signal peptidase I